MCLCLDCWEITGPARGEAAGDTHVYKNSESRPHGANRHVPKSAAASVCPSGPNLQPQIDSVGAFVGY